MKPLHLYMTLLLIPFLTRVGKAQQISQFSQYINNHYLINAASSNLNNNLNLALSFRKQQNPWLKNTDSYYLSLYKALKPVGKNQTTSNGFRDTKAVMNSTVAYVNPKAIQVLGGIISKDNFGLVHRQTAHANYGVHLPLNSVVTMSAGASVGYIRLRIADNFFVLEDNDLPFQQFMQGFDRQDFLDLSLGIALYSSKARIFYSVERLFSGNSIHEGNHETFRIKNQHFVGLGYRLEINDWSFTPSVLQRINHISDLGRDYTLQTGYKNNIWATFSLRNEEVLVMGIGLRLSGKMEFHFNYDSGAFNERTQSTSANEFLLKLRL
ncbi:PorP/SprF family type IX secretion system membrane protein [Roseivirga sp. UBA838]|uniref:PorP/SprF family type IX secretion system membrane protein n=1 Tax=Roseivirga sp. UBA838 TaxID=1947393 RepID=UPI0025796757|nr:PorP/SprF family type IX secretion system membrane protein [Roseivirga sp. UBA838]|tara:strand:- start:11338 stop:12309 length:972 start_codon:yes stop_codon:yes gene_type:complete